MIFVYVISQKATNRMTMEDWQHSGSTISVVFTRICKAIASLSQTFIKPPNFDAIPNEIRWNPKYYPYFQNCVGAIDGTHIAAHAPTDMANNFHGRKSTVTSNMLAICSFDMLFTYVVTGWEGAVHDSRMLTTQLKDPTSGFPHPPATGEINGPTELFNYRHASLRNCIERCFGYGVDGVMPPSDSDSDDDAPSSSGTTRNQGANSGNDNNFANDMRDRIMFEMYLNYN
ncbi:hypothetical protein UlMin_020063 [Ulmus minor]